jgi:hypothetical protein
MKCSMIAGTLACLLTLATTVYGNEAYVVKFTAEGMPLDVLEIDLGQADFARWFEVAVDGSIWVSRWDNSGGSRHDLAKFNSMGNELLALQIPPLPGQKIDRLIPTGFDFASNGNIYAGAFAAQASLPPGAIGDQIYVFNANGTLIDSFGGLGNGRDDVVDVKLTADDRVIAITDNPGIVYETTLDGTVVRNGFDAFDGEFRFARDLAITGDAIWTYMPQNGRPVDDPPNDFVVGYNFDGHVAHSIDVGFLTADPKFRTGAVVSIAPALTGNLLLLDKGGTLFEFTSAGNIIKQIDLNRLDTYYAPSAEDITIDAAGNVYVLALSLVPPVVPEPSTAFTLVGLAMAGIVILGRTRLSSRGMPTARLGEAQLQADSQRRR